jgi:hypothetical protein
LIDVQDKQEARRRRQDWFKEPNEEVRKRQVPGTKDQGRSTKDEQNGPLPVAGPTAVRESEFARTTREPEDL